MPLEQINNGPSETGLTARAKLNAWLTAINSFDADITALESDVAANTVDIASNTSDISDNTNNIVTNTANIATNTANIATNTSNIATNTSAIATNTTNIATNTSDISTINTNLSNKQDKNTVSTLTWRVVTNSNNFTFTTANDFFNHTNTGGTSVTVPNDSDAPNFLVGGEVEIYNNVLSSASVNITAGGGVTLTNVNSTNSVLAIGDTTRLRKIASNRWIQTGH